MALHLEIVTPKGPVVGTEVEEVVLPGKLGEFGVLEGHVPFLSALKPGMLRYRAGSEWKRLAVHTGFAEVGAGRKVVVLTEAHAFPDQIDLDETRQELSDLEAELKAWTGEITVEYHELGRKAAWARARLATRSENRPPAGRPVTPPRG